MTPSTEFVAQRTYEAFVAALPLDVKPATPPWEKLPELLKDAWKAAASAAREST